MKLSIVIPSYRDPYLFKTIEDILQNSELGDQLEVIAVWDGYYPTVPVIQDPRVRYVHLGKNRGMRGAINAGVDVSRGEFFMRLDEHCLFDKGFDKKLTDACQPNEIMTATRYFLDPIKWEVMQDKGHVEHEKLVIQNVSEGVRKFSGKPWRERDDKQKDVMLSETQAMQGSMWIMPRAWWDKHIGALQTEGYGPLIQDSVEVCMKTWKNGGRLVLNKNTWFAHKHRDFSRTHNNGTKENPAKQDEGYTYALNTWEDFYRTELLPKWEQW
jgi:glycosyltransferase involved in cell wall biosynthesis